MRIQLKGPAVIAVVLAILAVGGFRVATLGETTDAGLERAVRQELMIRVGMQTGQELNRLSDSEITAESVGRLADLSDVDGVEVHGMRVSAPVSGSGERIVRVEFTLPGRERATEYWVFDRTTPGSWDYRRQTTKLSYYLDFF